MLRTYVCTYMHTYCTSSGYTLWKQDTLHQCCLHSLTVHTYYCIQESGDGSRRLEWARLLKERNEYKEKYYALLDQVKLNDELSLFKNKSKKSRWYD